MKRPASSGASQSTQTVEMKRPAAALRRLATKRLARALTSGAATKKPGMTKSTKRKSILTASKCRTIVNKLKGVAGIPDTLRASITQRSIELLGKRSLKLRVEESDARSALVELARSVEEALQDMLQRAHASIKGAQFEKEERQAAQAAAQVRLGELKQAVVDEKTTLRNSEKAIEASRKRIKIAEVAHKNAQGEVKLVEGKKKQLELAKESAYTPLKESSAGGSQGQKRLSTLRKVGKAYGFHNEMLSVMPAVLKKNVQKRQTFDGLVMQYLDVEFARHTGALESQIKERERNAEEQSVATQEARDAFLAAKEAKKSSSQALADAEAALVAGKKKLLEAGQRVRAFPTEMGQAVRDLTLAKARIDKFRSGTLFRQLVPECSDF